MGKQGVMVSFTYPSTGEKIYISYITAETPKGRRIRDVIFQNRNRLHLLGFYDRPLAKQRLKKAMHRKII